jgi:hypothetical protein
MSHRVSDQVEILGHSPDEYRLFIILTGSEINQLMLTNPELAALVWDTTNFAPAFQCHPDIVGMQVQDSSIYLWELAFRAIGTQRLAMEKNFVLGT